MENNTALVVKQDGKVYAFNMPEIERQCLGGCARPCYECTKASRDHKTSVEQALSSAVECADQDDAREYILTGTGQPFTGEIKTDHPYVIPGLTFTVKRGKMIDASLCECGIGGSCGDCLAHELVALLSLTEIKEEKTEKQEPFSLADLLSVAGKIGGFPQVEIKHPVRHSKLTIGQIVEINTKGIAVFFEDMKWNTWFSWTESKDRRSHYVSELTLKY
jgi:hypothetical protein